MNVTVGQVITEEKAKNWLQNAWDGLIHWTWTKIVLYWIIFSAGTMSELCFLIASLWVSINASVHALIISIMPESLTIRLSQLAVTAYVGLPECILALAIVTTISHYRTWKYADDKRAAIWCVLYGVPTVVFLCLSLFTIASSVLSVTFTLPGWLVVIRALAGYSYGIVALLYTQLGKPQESDRLHLKDSRIAGLKKEMAERLATLQAEKDDFIAGLQKEKDDIVRQFTFENTNKLAALGSDKDRAISQLHFEKQSLQQQLDSQKHELTRLNEMFDELKNEKQQLFEALNQSSEEALQAYSQICLEWLNSNIKSATVDEINRYTGHSKKKIEGAITRGLLRTATHSKETRVMIASLIPWLKQNLPNDKGPDLRIVNE